MVPQRLHLAKACDIEGLPGGDDVVNVPTDWIVGQVVDSHALRIVVGYGRLNGSGSCVGL